MKKENIYNIPNPITLLRVLLTIYLIYFIFTSSDALWIAAIFAIAAFTDFLDGFLARKLNQVTTFGAKFDMLADRFLMIGTVLALMVHSKLNGFFTKYHVMQVVLIMMREMMTFPFAITNKKIPKAALVGKITTFMQGITFPLIILSTTYHFFDFSIYFAVATAIIGAYSALTYIRSTDFID